MVILLVTLARLCSTLLKLAFAISLHLLVVFWTFLLLLCTRIMLKVMIIFGLIEELMQILIETGVRGRFTDLTSVVANNHAVALRLIVQIRESRLRLP